LKEYLQFDLSLAEMIATTMHSKGLTVSVSESCTGGFISTFFTSVSGASRFFKGSITTYSNASKNQFLDVSNHDIDTYGVVSKEVVKAMASNIRLKFNTDYGLATTGYVENSNLQDTEILRAWIAIASNNKIISECVFLDKNRLQNISKVSYELLNLFVKEIV
tara:strand:- start:737 stop:1225 length:489 start_codon:yes stop_codon:yes gene_type:complete